MVTEATVYALLRIWGELPALVGPTWADLYDRLRERLEALAASSDAQERDWRVVELIELLDPHPAALRRLVEVRGMPQQVRHGGAEQIPNHAPPRWEDELLPAIEGRLRPPRVERTADITAPARLPLAQRGVITVGLTRIAPPHAASDDRLALRLDETVQVHLAVFSDAVEVQNDPVQEITVVADGDSPPVVFFVAGRRVGTADLRIELWQSGERIGAFERDLEVCAAEEPRELRSERGGTVVTGTAPPPPVDLDFQVLFHEREGSTRIDFVVHSATVPDLFFHETFAGEPRDGSVTDFHAAVMDSLEGLREGIDPTSPQRLTPAEVRRRMARLGEQLDRLLPSALRERLQHMESARLRTVQIVCKDARIPWELLRPQRPDPAEERFWCERYQVTRGIDGVPPPHHVSVRRAACIEAASGIGRHLPGAQRDRELLEELALAAGLDSESLSGATRQQVDALLDDGAFDLWHFAGHGMSDHRKHSTTLLCLAGESYLGPTDLHRHQARSIAARRPLVFLNVCSATRQRVSLIGLESWVGTWVQESRCGILVAPLCSVCDPLAHQFAKIFYQSLRQGETVGQATLAARLAVRDAKPEDPTWLAYNVYAHPNAKVSFGA